MREGDTVRRLLDEPAGDAARFVAFAAVNSCPAGILGDSALLVSVPLRAGGICAVVVDTGAGDSDWRGEIIDAGVRGWFLILGEPGRAESFVRLRDDVGRCSTSLPLGWRANRQICW